MPIQIAAKAWLPWCLSDSAETSPHPGALPPIPAGGDGWLIAPERGQLANCRTDLQAVSRWLAESVTVKLVLNSITDCFIDQ